jgi:pyruvate dehydrogenase E2 component (dihydrolipoamide acetyltransferase)
MPIDLKMPALSPTMEEGTLAKWLVKVGDTVRAGDVLAEIETDKATMEFEAVDEGTVTAITVAEGTDGVKVGTVIATIADEGEGAADGALPVAAVTTDVAPQPAPVAAPPPVAPPPPAAAPNHPPAPASPPPAAALAESSEDKSDRLKASPLARKLAALKGVDLHAITGSGPGGRIVRADVDGAAATAAAPVIAAPAIAATPATAPAVAPATSPVVPLGDTPHTVAKLSNMRKTIARRLTEAKATIPHIYLSVDVRLDALLKLRGELNAALAARGVKLSVNDMLVKALPLALIEVPKCNVSFTGDSLIEYTRADIAVAVSIPGGLITPIVTGADAKSLSAIATEIADLAARAKAGKLQPHEYQGGTASISNMGMMGITHFAAVINPPQAMILAVGAGEKRAVVDGDALAIATVMTVTGSFDHRAIDGADGAALLAAFKRLVEMPLGLVA